MTPLILTGILLAYYCGLAGCDSLGCSLLFITGRVTPPCDPVDLPCLAKAGRGRSAFYIYCIGIVR